MAINILIFQDLAAVGFLILIPAVSGSGSNQIHVTFLPQLLRAVLLWAACYC